MRKISAIGTAICCFLMFATIVGCEYGKEQLPKGHEVSFAVAPDGLSRASVWMPDQSGTLGATNSQPLQVWIQYLKGEQWRELLLKIEKTDGVKVTWRTTRELEICYGPSHIYFFRNFFEYGEQHSQQLYEVEVQLKRVQAFADCK